MDLKLKKKMAQFISDGDIKNYLGKQFHDHGILKYHDLMDKNTIDDIIPEKRGFKIVLIESHQNSGPRLLPYR